MTLDVPVSQGYAPPGTATWCPGGVDAVGVGSTHRAINFGALPPEVNSGRMYSGAGSGPLMEAAAAWDNIAAELSSAATSYDSVISELASMRWWSGPASDSMVAAALPFVCWLSATATLAEQTAIQGRATAAAFEAAFAMTVPPPVIAANRTLLTTLIATNWFGQNTPAIATTELQYAEMWAQDAAAMFGYASAAALSSVLTPFAPPPITTNPAALAGQTAAVDQAAGTTAGTFASTLSEATAHLISAAALAAVLTQHTAVAAIPWSDIQQYWIMFVGALATAEGFIYDSGGFTLMILGTAGQLLWAPAAATAGAGEVAAGASGAAAWSALSQMGAGPVAASAALAAKIGPMSVPPSWCAQLATPQAPPAGISVPSIRAATEVGEVSGLLRGVPTQGRSRAAHTGRRYGVRLTVMSRQPNVG